MSPRQDSTGRRFGCVPNHFWRKYFKKISLLFESWRRGSPPYIWRKLLVIRDNCWSLSRLPYRVPYRERPLGSEPLGERGIRGPPVRLFMRAGPPTQGIGRIDGPHF